MFNLGFPELIALGGLALLVIGPKQLPEVAKAVARVLNEVKNATKDITGTIANVKSEATSTVDTLLHDITDSVTNIDSNEEDELLAKNVIEEANENQPTPQNQDDDNQLSLLSQEDLEDDRS